MYKNTFQSCFFYFCLPKWFHILHFETILLLYTYCKFVEIPKHYVKYYNASLYIRFILIFWSATAEVEESLSVGVLSSVCQDVLSDASLSMFKVSCSKKQHFDTKHSHLWRSSIVLCWQLDITWGTKKLWFLFFFYTIEMITGQSLISKPS